LARAGDWEAFGGTTTNGRGVCGISSEVGMPKRYFSVKFYAGSNTFTLQLRTAEWTANDGEKVPVTMQLDDNPIWRANGTMFRFQDGDAGVQFSIRRAELDNFAREFRTSSLLKLQFKNGRFSPWSFDLEGVAAVDSAFQNCIGTLN
jgi:hypothetical protein